MDLGHRLLLYTRDSGKPVAAPPPVSGVPARTIPPIAPTRDITSSISARFFIQQSIVKAGHTVPFYFDPTIGGSDINGQSMLPSYPADRFRAPNLLLIHGAYEQSLGKSPLVYFSESTKPRQVCVATTSASVIYGTATPPDSPSTLAACPSSI